MRVHRLVLSLALVAAALFTSSSLRSAAFTGTIAGTVTEDSGSTPLVGITVTAYNSSGSWMGSDTTIAGGVYDIPGLAPGTYYVRTSNSAGYVDEAWDDQECVACNVQTTGAPVVVVDSATTTIDFELALGGTISGTVLGAGNPLEQNVPVGTSVFVTIADAGNQFVVGVSTIAGGLFTTPALPAGTYFARVSTNLGYINEIWNNVQCQFSCQLTSAAPIVVTAGGTASGINFDLEQGARFSGSVENGGSTALAGVQIDVRNIANQSVASATTAADGTFTTSPGVPAGDYFLKTSNAPSYINETNDGQPCIGFCDLEGRTPVTAAAGSLTTGVDFVLDPGGSISGTVLNALSAPLQNVTVNVVSITGSTITSGFTNAAGQFTSRDGLLPGTYYLTTTNGLGYINQVYPAIPCLPSCTVSSGTPVNIVGTGSVTGINFSMVAGGRITGHVTGAGGVDLSGVTVSVINAAGTTFSTGFTDANGNYTTGTGLPNGSYYLRTGNSRGLINEVYPDVLCQGTLCPSPVGVGVLVAVTGGVLPFVPVTVDMDLSAGGRISGTVADAGSSAAVVGANVQVYSLTGQSLGSATTDGLGNYISSAGLTTGQFYVRTSNALGYIDELYDNVVCGFSCQLSLGTDVGVTTGAVTSGVDFGLSLGGTITGTVTTGGGATPLGNLNVQIVNAATNAITSDTTDASGNFSVKGLPDGTYYARTSNVQGYINEVYNNLQCPLNCTNIFGAPLVIAGANTVAGVTFDLEVGARIAGVITDDVSGLPIPGVSVSIVELSGLTVANGTTNSLGEYISGVGLPTGSYYVRTNNSLGYINELYNNISCATGCSLATGATVLATAGSTTTGVNFGLSAGGRASGQVIDAGTGNPLQGIFVQIYDASGRSVGGSSTDASGNFVTGSGLSTGTYYARTTNSQGYLDELFNNKPCVGSCSVLAGDGFVVTVGATTPNINFSLTQGGRISGTITDATTSAPLTSVSVSVYDSTGRFVASGGTNSFGVYTTSQGLATGTYYLRTNNGLGYINELFGGTACVGNCVVTAGTAISVTSPATTSGVNFQLSAGGRISGTVTEFGGGVLSGVSVTIYNSAGVAVSGSSTNALGIYRTTAGLPDGTYTARTFNGQGLINQLYSGTTCLGQCDVTLGAGITIAGLAEVSGVDFALTRGARVSGTITNGGNPVPGALGSVYNSANVRVATGQADGSGNFVTSEGLPPDTYFARSDNSVGLVNQVHAGIDCFVVCDPTTGTGIALSGTGITGGINFALTPDADGDADGIVNTIDPLPAAFSNDFNDLLQGGTSDGTISNRDTWTIKVGDVSPSGIQIDLSGVGGAAATFDVCALNGTQRILLDVAGESAVYACDATTGSTSVRALNALPIVELRDPATGPGIIIQLGTGQGATTGSPVTALSSNTDAITVIIVDGTGSPIGSFELDAGESALVVVNPDGSADAEVIEGVVEITVRGESVVLEPGETYDFPPPVGPGYTFTGFFSPLSNPPAVNIENAGHVIPVLFSLGGPQGLDVLAPGFPKAQPMSCTDWTPLGPAVSTNAFLGVGLTYLAGPDRYAYLWKTDSAWTGTCRQLQVMLDDGSTHVANIKFKGFTFTGFFSPVKNPPFLNNENAGSFVQLHFSLGGFEGFDVFAGGSPTSQQINCSTKAPIGVPQAIGSPSGLLYNPFNGRYTYVWKTQNSWKNTCREFQATFDDGTTKTAWFKFK